MIAHLLRSSRPLVVRATRLPTLAPMAHIVSSVIDGIMPPPDWSSLTPSHVSPAAASFLILESKMRHLRCPGQYIDDQFPVGSIAEVALPMSNHFGNRSDQQPPPVL